MKKIYINETSLGNIKEYGLLPKFLFKMVKDHKTSLGDNEAFPKIGEYPFDYSILKKRFEDVSFHIKSTLNEYENKYNTKDKEAQLAVTLQSITRFKKDINLLRSGAIYAVELLTKKR